MLLVFSCLRIHMRQEPFWNYKKMKNNNRFARLFYFFFSRCLLLYVVSPFFLHLFSMQPNKGAFLSTGYFHILKSLCSRFVFCVFRYCFFYVCRIEIRLSRKWTETFRFMSDTAQAIICQKIGNLFPYAIAGTSFFQLLRLLLLMWFLSSYLILFIILLE